MWKRFPLDWTVLFGDRGMSWSKCPSCHRDVWPGPSVLPTAQSPGRTWVCPSLARLTVVGESWFTPVMCNMRVV